MPRLPGEEQLGAAPQLQSRQVPSNIASNVVDFGGPSQATEAAGNLGREVQEIARRVQEREDKLQYQRQKSEFLQKSLQVDNDFIGDTDYKTYGKRYTEKMQKARRESLEAIENPYMREQFEQETETTINRGLNRMAEMSWKMERDNGRATIDGIINQDRSLYLQAPDEGTRTAVLENTREAIQTGRENGYLSAEEAQGLMRKTAQDYAEAYVEMQPAEEQIRLLKSGEEIAGLIPADKRKALIENVDMRGVSQKEADRIVASEASDAEMIEMAQDISDPVVRDETVARIKNHISTQDSLLKDRQNEAFDNARDVLVEANSLDAIDKADWKNMSGSQRLQLRDYVEARAAKSQRGRTQDNYDVLDEVDGLIESGQITDPSQLAIYEPYLRDATIRAKRKQIQKRGEVSPTDVRRSFEDRLGKTRSKWSDDEREQWIEFQEYVADHVQETKRPEDINAWADRWFMEGYTKEDRWGPDPDTFGEAFTEGREFLIETPEGDTPDVEGAMDVLRQYGDEVGKGQRARDDFYTRFYLEGKRSLDAMGVPVEPISVAAYAKLQQAGKPVNRRNIQWVTEQMQNELE